MPPLAATVHRLPPLGRGPTRELAPSRGPGANLVYSSGAHCGKAVPLVDSLTVGRSSQADVPVDDPSLRPLHAKLFYVDDRVWVRDLGGGDTYVDGARVVEAEVRFGARVRLGDFEVSVREPWYQTEVSPSPATRFGGLLGESTAMREVFAVLERVSASEISVLIQGETGTGKELCAKAIHEHSPRRCKPFAVFDCSAVPKELAESELFGHRRGAFSGAVEDRLGAFQQADGGTLCLDEIGEMPLGLQAKLLRVLEDGHVRPVGADATRRVDVRILASTNRDLEEEVERGRFRKDLWYRLNAVTVELPALRHRPRDIAPLVEHLAGYAARDVAGANLEKLCAYAWPGNVRELRNVLGRARAMAPTAAFGDLILNLGPPSRPSSPWIGCEAELDYKIAKSQLLARFERHYVDALLVRHDKNISRAAAAAGLSRKHLYDLIRRVRAGC